MSRHVSKADEASSWRRTTALPREQKQPSAGGYQQHPGGHHHRSQSAEPTVHAAGRHHHLGGMQPLEPVKAVPATFCAEEALHNLERRWLEVTSQGLQPTCQCSSTSKEDAAADGSSSSSTAAKGSSTAGSDFLAALQAACKVKSADAAWDDD